MRQLITLSGAGVDELLQAGDIEGERHAVVAAKGVQFHPVHVGPDGDRPAQGDNASRGGDGVSAFGAQHLEEIEPARAAIDEQNGFAQRYIIVRSVVVGSRIDFDRDRWRSAGTASGEHEIEGEC